MTDGGPVDALCGWFDVWFRGSDEAAVDNEIRLSTGPDPTGEGGSRGAVGWGQAAAGGQGKGHGKQHARGLGRWPTVSKAKATPLCRPKDRATGLHQASPFRFAATCTPTIPIHSCPHPFTSPSPRPCNTSSLLSNSLCPRRHALGAADVPAAPAHRLRARRQAARGAGGEPAAGQPAAAGRQGRHQRGGRQHIRGAVQEPAHVPVEHRVRAEGLTS